ncbi:MAG: hypothetical protein MET45_10760 [Nostoc sp. LLA-1]|nr:hypothetical protein [Cyanocohniella sp. LLY]
MLTILGAILMPGIEAKAQTFIGGSDIIFIDPIENPDFFLPPIGNPRNLPPGIASVRIPPTKKIEGTLFNSGDINLYELQLGFDGKLTVESFDVGQIIDFSNPSITETLTPSFNLFLFDQDGQGLATAFSKLNFSGVKDEIFYLAINGTVALNESEEPILDPFRPNFIGSGSLASWQNPGGVLQALRNYQISFTATPVPETSSTLSFLALAILGVASSLKSKFSKKETTKVG